MMTSLELKPAARQIATAWRWPPREPADPGADRGHVDRQVGRPSLGLALASRGGRGGETGPKPCTISRLRNRFCQTVRSSTRARFWCTVSIPGLAGVLGGREVHGLAVEDDGAGVGRVDAADAADQGGLAGAVVADDAR